MTNNAVELRADKVTAVFEDCLFKDGEDTSQHVKAEGIIITVGFHPDRLKQHESEIVALLAELPNEFQESGGGGMSFLQACVDRHGNLWTGLHQVMEQLFLLGIASGKVVCPMPRNMWSALPGGMPYYMVKRG